jgi:hypothetical protein
MPWGMSFAGIAASDHGRTSHRPSAPFWAVSRIIVLIRPARRVADMDAQTSARYDGRTILRMSPGEHHTRASAESFVSHSAANSSTCKGP